MFGRWMSEQVTICPRSWWRVFKINVHSPGVSGNRSHLRVSSGNPCMISKEQLEGEKYRLRSFVRFGLHALASSVNTASHTTTDLGILYRVEQS